MSSSRRSSTTAFQIPPRDPARPQSVIEIRGPNGRLLDRQQDRYVMPGARGWTEAVHLMGYRPLTRWTTVPVDAGPGVPAGAAHMCRVEPAPVLSSTGHAAAHLAPGILPTCLSHTTLTAEFAAKLGGWEFGYSAGDIIVCEYALGHRIPHTGLGQPHQHTPAEDERHSMWWWLLWSHTDDPGTLSEALLCGAEGSDARTGAATDPCILPLGHAESGACDAHSWQVAAFNPFLPGRGVAFRPRTRPLRRPGQR